MFIVSEDNFVIRKRHGLIIYNNKDATPMVAMTMDGKTTYGQV